MMLSCVLTGCMSPPGVFTPTRTPPPGKVVAGGSLERSEPVGAGRPIVLPGWNPGEVPPLERAYFQARGRGWAMVGVTERLAATMVVAWPVPYPTVGGQWNFLRSRYLDLAVTARAGYDACFDVGSLPYSSTRSFCESGAGVGEYLGAYAHGSAVALVGVNPWWWLTVQAQVGGWGRYDVRGHAGPWLGGNAQLYVNDSVALVADVAVLPGWFLDGRALLQPSLGFAFWPTPGTNPYRFAP